jgi:uncharacterized protein YggE
MRTLFAAVLALVLASPLPAAVQATVTVKTDLTPDTAVVTVQVMASGLTEAQTRAEEQAQLDALGAALKGAGVDPASALTLPPAMSGSNSYNLLPPPGAGTDASQIPVILWTSVRRVGITCPIALAPKVLAVAGGPQRVILGPVYKRANMQAALDAARGQAFAEAQRQCQDAAAKAGVTLTTVMGVAYSTSADSSTVTCLLTYQQK